MTESPIPSLPLRLPTLSKTQIHQVYAATLDCLERTGVHMPNARARDLLARAGARVDGARVRIPAHIIAEAISSTPHSFRLWRRDRGGYLDVGGERTYFGPGPTCTYFLDPASGERRRARRGDPACVALVSDALPNMDYVMGLGLIDDAPPGQAAICEFAEMVTHTAKPVLAWAEGPADLAAIYDIALAIAGSAECLADYPFFSLFLTCQAPLVHTDAELGNALWAAERGIPLVYMGGGCAGVSAPVTGAGTLVISLAGILSGLAAIQLTQPGAPVCLGALASAMDLHTAAPAYGSPEMSLYSAAVCDVLRHLGLPFMGTAGATEAKTLDLQAAIECTLQVNMAQLSGAALVHDVGFLECGETGSLECLVMNDEIIAMARRSSRGIQIDDETLALDLIDQVGPGGEFASQMDTARRCRAEIWQPRLMDRARWPLWQAAGSKSMNDRISKRLQTILDTHRPPPLPPAAAQAIAARLQAEPICAAPD